MIQFITLAYGCSLAAVVAIFYFLLRRTLVTQSASWYRRGSSSPERPTAEDTAPPHQQVLPGVRVCQVCPLDDKTETDVDIIAVHGLDTKSPDTWIWREQHGPHSVGINWLTNPQMLPLDVPRARIFTCDWPATLFNNGATIEMTTNELARKLLHGIEARDPVTDRPIMFIASCLGGIVLSKALTIAAQEGSGFTSLWLATGGIIFLATPFRGTAFQQVAREACLFLHGYAKLSNNRVTHLLDSVKESTPFLQDLVGEFTSICRLRGDDCHLGIFYEMEKGNLMRKVFSSWLADYLNRPTQLVDSGSARLDIVPNPIALERNHVMMNKFHGPEDPGYIAVARKISLILKSIRQRRPIDRADAIIRGKCYTQDKLRIERLSGHFLPMEQCYINLAIIERPGDRKNNPQGEDSKNGSSPFSLNARLSIERPEEAKEVPLPTLFDLRKGSEGVAVGPKRILIRGRAGVGKTTLCKKIVHDFTYGTMWNDKFDRLLWIPLRNLKRKSRVNIPGYSLQDLFCHEFFGSGAIDLAKALSHEILKEKTLFLLDGLDEVWSDLEGDMRQFLTELLNQPNLVVTSRPHVVLPRDLGLDLELETVGFYAAQIGEYLRVSLDSATVPKVESFLQSHHLVRDLVRIPIQLDAFCFTWDVENSPTPQTMTAFYSAIVGKLYSKDAAKLGKLREGETAPLWDLKDVMDNQLEFLEALAFSGMHTDRIDFEPEFRGKVLHHVMKKKIPLLDGQVPSMSFLHTQDSSYPAQDQTYHFLHLTFQEYFAARYFVQRWNETQSLECLVPIQRRAESISPVAYLQKHKYDTRYDIMWRFVAGLLNEGGEDEMRRFFEEIEKEPFDVLGPAHQRLVMHCLNEALDLPTRLREQREKRLLQWVLFERDLTRSSTFARESELPEWVLYSAWTSSRNTWAFSAALQGSQRQLSATTKAALVGLFQHKNSNVRSSAADILGNQSTLSDTAIAALVELFKDEGSNVRRSGAKALGKQSPLSDITVKALMELFKDEDSNVRRSAAKALGKQSTLSDTTVKALMELFKDEDSNVRRSAAKALGKQSTLSDTTMTAFLELFRDENSNVRYYAAKALGNQSTLSDTTMAALMELFEDEDWKVRECAAGALGKQSTLSDITIAALMELLKDDDSNVRYSAAEALGNQSTFPDTTIAAFVELFKDENSNVRFSAASALGNQLPLSDTTMAALVELIKDEDYNVRSSAASALGNQSTLSDTTIAALVELLKDEDWSARSSAADILGNQSRLLDTTIAALMELFKDEDYDVRSSAANILGNQSTLSDATMAALVELLKDQHERVRSSAAEALGNQSTLSDTTMAALVELLKDEDSNVRRSAAFALGKQSPSSDTTMAALVELFKDEDWKVRECAAGALGKQSTLSDTTIAALVELLKDEDSNVRRSAAFALGKQSPSSDTTMNALLELFKDEDWIVQRSAAEALGNQSTLSDTTMDALVELLKDEDSNIRRSATNALAEQSPLSDNILDALGIPIQVEAQTRLGPRIFRRSRYVEPFYESFLKRSFNEHFTIYADGDAFVVNQASGLRTATLEDQLQFQTAVKKGRERLKKSDSYSLWSTLEE